MKTISIVIPTFNRKLYLKKCIDSCLSQTYKSEIIVSDHGSTDGTNILLSEFKNKIRYLRREENLGPHFSWLDGIINAKGEYVHLLYDDDYIKPQFIEKCINLFTEEVGFVFCPTEHYSEKDKRVVNILYKDLGVDEGIHKINKFKNYFLNSLLTPSAAIFRKKDLIESIYQGGLPLSKYHYKGVGPDKFASLLCLLRYKYFGYVKESLSVCNLHIGSISTDSQQDNQKRKQLKKAYEEVNEYYYILKFSKHLPIYKILKIIPLFIKFISKIKRVLRKIKYDSIS
jgi:glycosyltransferase involved in cell wall biosynthesis